MTFEHFEPARVYDIFESIVSKCFISLLNLQEDVSQEHLTGIEDISRSQQNLRSNIAGCSRQNSTEPLLLTT